MSITFACVHCGKSFTIDDKFAGKKGRCKQCGAVMDIPGPRPERTLRGSMDQEISPSRRPPAPAHATASVEDRYALDDGPTLGRGGLPPGIEEVESARPFGTRSNPRAPSLYDPPKKKRKKSGGGGGIQTLGRIALGVVGVLVALGVVGVGLRFLASSLIPGLSSKGDVESILQERVALNEQLVTLLEGITDVQAAETMSPRVNQKLRAIAANLRRLKTMQVLKTDLEALRLKYQAPQMQATQRVIGEFVRIGRIPDAGLALKVEAALQELDVEERAIPGINQSLPPLTPTPTPTPGPSGPRPGMTPSPTPFNNPPTPGNMPRPGNRRGKARPGPGPGFGPNGPG